MPQPAVPRSHAMLSIEPAVTREQVFLSYSHKDEYWLAELQTMLKPLLKRRTISIWSDTLIEPGEEWHPRIHAALSAAKVAILLVSKHFLASKFITDEELPAILKMRESGLKVLWIPVSHSMYVDTELKHLQALHDVSSPLDSLDDRHRDKSLFAICEKIRDILLEPPATENLAGSDLQAASATTRDKSDRSPLERHDTDLNLLFGAVAVQNQFIEASTLAEGCVLWSLRKSQPLSEILVEQGALSLADRADVQRLVDRRLRANSGNVAATLRSSTDSSVCDILRRSQVPEVLQSLDALATLDGPLQDSATDLPLEWRAVFREGTLGEVWTGFDPVLGREVALKVVRNDRASQVGAQARLLQEARINGRLEHPHIVPVYALGTRPDGTPYYSMRLVHGPTLAEDIERHHRTRINDRVDAVERRRLLENFLSVCHAVAYAHSRGFLHLDLKPQNVILGEFREVYLLDWGLAQSNAAEERVAPVSAEASRATPMLIGTPAYMSPEQAAGNAERFDVRTDVYGLGAILFEILTGKPPHDADNLEQLLRDIQVKDAPSPRELLSSIAPSLNELEMRALSRDPQDRFASAEDLALAVERWLDDEPLAVYRENIERYQQKIKEEPDTTPYREGLARNFVAQGLVLFGIGRLPAAEFSLRQGIEVFQNVLKDRPSPSALGDLATAWLHLHYLLRDTGKPEEAEAAKREALKLYFQLRRSSPGQDGQHSILLPMMTMHFEEMDAERLSDKQSEATDQSENQMARLTQAEGNANSEEEMDAERLSDKQSEAADQSENQMALLTQAEGYANSELEPPRSESGARTTVAPESESSIPSTSNSVETLRERWSRRDFVSRKVIGEGGMGTVFQVRDDALNREVALKTLKTLETPLNLNRSGTFHEVLRHRDAMFFSEAIITADLYHPNILPIYTTGIWNDGQPFYTMPHIRGDGWHKRLKEMTLEENLEVLMKVSDAIGFAHSRHIFNRDLKPENVMLGEFGETIVLDWGLALPFGEGKGRLPMATTAGLGSGTPAYMPPELITGPLAKIGPACDIYLLGAMLFQVITGLPPHDFSTRPPDGTLTAAEKLAEVRRVVVDNVIRETTHTGELMDIATKAMATNPEDRYRTVKEFQNAIRDYMKHAASHTLADRAKEMTTVAAPIATEAKPAADVPSVGYADYQNALALYNESLREWPGNEVAREGLTATQLNFAKLALIMGDFDLGLSVLDTNADSHSETRSKLLLVRQEREGRIRLMKLWKVAAAVSLVGNLAAIVWILSR